MNPKTETGHAGGFILSEAHGSRSRENALVAQAQVLLAGTVLAALATDPVTYAAFDVTGTNGADVPVAILIADVNTDTSGTDADTPAAVMARDCEVNGKELVWPDGITDNQIAAAVVQLKAVGIIVR